MNRLLLTEQQVNRVARRAEAARAKLLDSTTRGAIVLAGEHYWGQFLDDARSHEQKGIFGTAAGVEILASHGQPAHMEPFIAALKGAGACPPAMRQRDATLVFKVAALVAATATETTTLEDPAVGRLLEMMVDDRGWGGYSTTTAGPDAPDALISAVALQALSVVPAWRADTRCRLSLSWLAQQLVAEATGESGEALGLLSLNLYRSVGADLDEWRQAVSVTQSRVGDRLSTSGDILRSLPFHYPVVIASEQEGKYMFYCPAIVGALALLEGDPSRPVVAGRRVAQVVSDVADAIDADGALRLNGRKSTVDQMWANRLLRKFVRVAESDPSRLLQPVGAFLFAGSRRWVATICLVLTALIAGALAIDGDLNGVIRSAAGVYSTIATSFLAVVLWSGRSS